VAVATGSWTSFDVAFGWGTPQPFPPEAYEMTIGAILNYDAGIGGNRVYQVQGLGIFDFPRGPRTYRSQAFIGTLTAAAPVPGAITFPARAGETATLSLAVSGRPDAVGHTYLNTTLDGLRVGSTGDWASTTWRRTMFSTVHVPIATTGMHDFAAALDIGNGTTSFADTPGEWPYGGATWTVTVGD